jgi:HEAT repeat protein
VNSLKDYVEKLNCADEAERIYAAEDIGQLNTPEGALALLDRLDKESSRAVRDAIFRALNGTDGNLAVEGPIRLLGSDDPQIRNQAVDVLRRKSAHSIPFLNTVMRNGDKDMRKLVLDVLGGIQASDTGEIYAAALADPDVNVVITAVENLGRIRAVEFRDRIEDLLQSDSHPMLTAACVEALASIGNASSLAALRRCFPELAKIPDFLLTPCLKAIAVLGSARDFNEVAALLPARGPHLRSAILGALLAIYPCGPSPAPDQALLGALQAVVDDGDPPLCRYQAVRVMGVWVDRNDVCAFLVACLASTERLVRLGAAESLRAANRPELASVLTARLPRESDEEVLQALSC